MNELNNITEGRLNILIVEDSKHDLELIKEQLYDAGYILELTHVLSESSLLMALGEKEFDIILSDFNLPGFTAFDSLRICKQNAPDTPFVCISGSIGEVTATDLLKQGADDYVLKDRPERLPFAVKRALDDAKERKAYMKAVKALQESEDRFKQVAENAQEWIWEVDETGLYTYSSPVVTSLLGYTPDELVGKKYFYDLFIPEKRDILKITSFEVFKMKQTFRSFENPNVHKDGRVLMLTTSGSPIFDNDGNFKGYRGVDTDYTEKTKILEELMLAKEKAEESDKLKTAFINNISHEIRTPLNGILGFGQLLSEAELPAEQRVQYFNIIKKSSNRLINTVSDYLDMARLVTGTMEVGKKEFPILDLMEKVITYNKEKIEEKNLTFELTVPDNNADFLLYSDPDLIDKVFHILLDNAAKFTTKGVVRFGFSVLNGFVGFFVSDTGVGIESEKMSKIFDMFSQGDYSNTRGYDGSGLGLAIAKGMVSLLGGSISVTSEKGKGSVFTFTVPYVAVAKPEVKKVVNSETSFSKKPLILVAEDEELNFMYVEVILKMADFDYIHVVNGAEAVDACRQNPDISLVLMDIKMPVMNGIEATKLIHEFRPDLPIIATTAYAQTGDENRFMAAGCNGYLAKPIKRADLLSIMKKFI